MRTYFKDDQGLRRIDVDVTSIGTAQVEAYLAALDHNITPTTTVLAVIEPGDEVTN